MPLDVSPQQILDNICPCPDFNARFSSCEVVTSNAIPVGCYNASLPSTASLPQINKIAAASTNDWCPAGSFPTVGGVSVLYQSNNPPFRVVFDEKAAQFVENTVTNISSPNLYLRTDCEAALNGSFPGCSRTAGGGACSWTPEILGEKTAFNTFESCGGAIRAPTDFLNAQCAVAATFCLRGSFDYSYKKACCKQTLQTDFNLDEPIYLSNTVFLHPSMRVGNTAINSATFNEPITSQSYNPYTLYCDPYWCPNSPSCDPVFYEECEYSVTGTGANTKHACLAETGMCREWYSRSVLNPTPEAALLTGLHDWRLLDRMMQNYCINSATALGDTTSCACIGTGVASIDKPETILYFSSCSTLGITTNCPQGVVPVVPVDGPPQPATLTGVPRILNNLVCANSECLTARTDASRFLTSGALQKALACPNQVCLLANMNSTFTIGNIGTGTRYIGNTTQFCDGTSFSANAPTARLVYAPTIWFYSNELETITNPGQVSILRIENVSSDANTNMNWSISWAGAPTGGLPSWLQFQGTTSGLDVFPGLATTVQWGLGPVTKTPAYFDLPLTVYLLGPAGVTFSQQDILLNFAIVDIDKKNAPLPSGGDTDPDNVPLNIREKYSPGAMAMLGIVVILLLVSLIMIFQSWRISNLTRKALFWAS